MQLNDEAWAAIRLLFETTAEPLATLGQPYGATPLAIGAKAKREAWDRSQRPVTAQASKKLAKAKQQAKKPKRKSSSAAAHTTKRRQPSPARQVAEQSACTQSGAQQDARPHSAKEGSAGGLPGRQQQAALIARLYRAISLKLEQMETRMANGEDRSAQDEERESRALGTMIANFEKVTEVVSGFDRAAEPAARGTQQADAERMRREIATRLERLASQRNDRGGPREP